MAGKPLPTVIKQLRGTLRKHRRAPNEPQPPGELAEPPEYMSDGAKAAWRFAIDSAPRGLLRRLDMSILETWACASDVYRQAQGEIAKNRMLYTLPNGSVMQSPYLTIANRQSALMIKAASEMGFTPSSRSRISGIESAENEVNEWDRVT